MNSGGCLYSVLTHTIKRQTFLNIVVLKQTSQWVHFGTLTGDKWRQCYTGGLHSVNKSNSPLVGYTAALAKSVQMFLVSSFLMALSRQISRLPYIK